MNESTALIKLTKSEIESIMIALTFFKESSKFFGDYDDWSNEYNHYKKLWNDFNKIKMDIIEGENDIETRNKKEEANRNSPQACKSCDD